jgi:uroporphyrinogen decarboxylase
MPATHDRVIAALERREPDRVPTMDMMIEYSNVNEILGKPNLPVAWFLSNNTSKKAIDLALKYIPGNAALISDLAMDIFAYDRTRASVKLGYDSAWVQHAPVGRFDDSRNLHDIYGRRFQVTFDGRGSIGTPMYLGGNISGPDDWKALDKRDMFLLPDKNFKAYRRLVRRFGDDLFIFGSFSGGLFELTWQCMGFEPFILATRRQKPFLRRMIRFYTDLYCVVLEAMAEAGLPGAIYFDDLGYRTGPMLNPKLLEDLYGEGHRQITSTAHRLGMKIVIHSCGNVYDLLGWFADNGFDGVHALEPTAGMELAKAKEMIGDRLCLLGNVDVTHTLVDAGKKEVMEEVRSSIEAAGKGGGYIVAPTNSHPGMSVQRLRWMIEAVYKYGTYPLSF